MVAKVEPVEAQAAEHLNKVGQLDLVLDERRSDSGANVVVGVGNTTGEKIDKFAKFKLTRVDAEKVEAPLIKECYANFECKVIDATLVQKYSFFIMEIVKAHVAVSPKVPRTIHYRGDGQFMVSGREVSFRKMFRPENM